LGLDVLTLRALLTLVKSASATLASPPRELSFRRACRRAATQLARGYLHFLPGIAATWFFAEGAAPAVPAPLAITRPVLGLLASVFVSAAAARTAGRHAGRNVVMLGVERASSFLTLFLLLLAALVLAALLVGGAIAIGEPNHPEWVRLSLAVWGSLLLLGSLRFWPAPAIAFHSHGKIRWSPAVRGSAWVGPGLGMAWRLTKAPGVVRRASLPFVLVGLPCVGGFLALRNLATLPGPVLHTSNLLFYAVAVPFLLTLADGLTAQLLRGAPRLAEPRSTETDP
jgi:hypothetical protein